MKLWGMGLLFLFRDMNMILLMVRIILLVMMFCIFVCMVRDVCLNLVVCRFILIMLFCFVEVRKLIFEISFVMYCGLFSCRVV